MTLKTIVRLNLHSILEAKETSKLFKARRCEKRLTVFDEEVKTPEMIEDNCLFHYIVLSFDL